PPSAATLSAPSGGIASANPSYTWQAVPSAVEYAFWVAHDGSGYDVSVNLRPADLGCGAGGTCTYRPALQLQAGLSYRWGVVVRNAAGWSPHATPLTFSLAQGSTAPAPVTPASSTSGASTVATAMTPAGAGNATRPAFVWSAIPGVQTYSLSVVHNGSSDYDLAVYVTPEQAGCGTGAGTCSYTPSVSFSAGNAYRWSVTPYVGGAWDYRGNTVHFSVGP
ncbi:MAG TPA: hypothetical protein VIT92_14190, partial [Burkholderiaceae bacterium]